MEKRHQSIWTETQCPRPTYPTLKGSCHCDVAIVGAGITGLTTAYELKKAGVSVIVLEAETLGGGTTGRTSGHLSSLWDGRYSTVLTKHGIDKVTTIYPRPSGRHRLYWPPVFQEMVSPLARTRAEQSPP